jgi:catechol 2,3-dioxygenase-like lactoylglutathione lyase family enzyme
VLSARQAAHLRPVGDGPNLRRPIETKWEDRMAVLDARLAGVELYFDNLTAAKEFYAKTLGLPLQEDDPHHHAKLGAGDGFVCLERKGVENYPSADKAVLFLEVPSVRVAVDRIGTPHVLRVELGREQRWAAVRDPEGHTVLLLQRPH